MPGLRVFDVVEAEDKEGPEAADFLVHAVELGRHGRGRAYQPVVFGAVRGRHVGVRDRRVVLEEGGEAKGPE